MPDPQRLVGRRDQSRVGTDRARGPATGVPSRIGASARGSRDFVSVSAHGSDFIARDGPPDMPRRDDAIRC